MESLNRQNEDNHKKLIEKINVELKAQVEKIFEKQDELFKLGDILKYQGIENIKRGEIRFKKPLGYDEEYHLHSKVKSLYHIQFDYEERFIKLCTKYNSKNPFSIEITFENKNAPDGAIIYSKGKWIVMPYRPEGNIIKKDFIENIDYPKYAILAFNPEETSKQEGKISRLIDTLYYEPTHLRFGNDFKKQGYSTLVLSKYIPNRFVHSGSPQDEIIDKWSFLIPYLKESLK